MAVGKPGHELSSAPSAVAWSVEVLTQPGTGSPACPHQRFSQHGAGADGTRTLSTRQCEPHCPLTEERALYLLI